ncbi:MAG TPA: hypothetical protein DC049_09605, partial [Spirochaetia bacterium]|nr:hypothetical protein [Spirochaetia bacterium]
GAEFFNKKLSANERKKPILEVNPDYGFILTAELNHDIVLFSRIDSKLNVQIIKKEIISVQSENNSFIKYFSTTFDQLIAKCQSLEVKSRLLGIGISVPGRVHHLLKNGNYISSFLKNQANEIVLYFKKKYNLPVIIENLANARAIGEQFSGEASQMKNIIWLNIGHGAGAGIIINGELYQGSYGRVGEIGHIIVDPEGKYCSCGNQGCLEAYIGRQAIIKYLDNLKPENIDSPVFLDSLYGEPATVFSLCRKYFLSEEKIMLCLIETIIDKLARVLAILVNTLAPETIFIGGEITVLGGKFIQAVKEAVKKYVLRSNIEFLDIRYSSISETAGAAGLASLVLKEDIFRKFNRKIK